MTSVRNLRLRLNGNKWVGCSIAIILLIAGCTPKVRVLRGPGDKTTPTTEESKEAEKRAEIESEEAKVDKNHIALLLPFELDKANPHAPSTADIKRSALALDFYQGFKLGLDALVEKEGSHFKVNVLDTRDDVSENARVAKLEEVQQAALVVGPVFPKEIQVFGFNADLKNALQISPLAASMPSEFNIPNLVTITPPITAHVNGLAKHIARQYRTGDVVVLYQTQDAASKQFLSPLKAAILRADKSINVEEVSDEEGLDRTVRLSGKNLVVLGTTNAYQLSPILAQLTKLQEELSYDIRLFGHPNWAKLDFQGGGGLAGLRTYITTSYYIDQSDPRVRTFDQHYRKTYGVAPTEFAYKGYDAAFYFGGLLAKYGADYKKHVADNRYNGLHNAFEFEYNPAWGYVNNAVSILQYRAGSFQPLP